MLIGEARKPSMRLSSTTLATAAAAILVIYSTVIAAQTGQGVVRGEVTDSSGGVLPGVTVVATAADGRLLETTVTDRVGGYVFRALPAGPAILRFQLEGFTSVVVRLGVQPGAETRVVERLEVAPLSETVVVHGDAPVDPTPFSPSSPPPMVTPVPVHDRDSVCGPAKPGASPESFGTIRSGRYEAKAGLYTAGTELIIDGGMLNGLEVGRNLVVRRFDDDSCARRHLESGRMRFNVPWSGTRLVVPKTFQARLPVGGARSGRGRAGQGPPEAGSRGAD